MKNSKDSELTNIAETIKEALTNRYKKTAANFAAGRKTLIVPIPDDVFIDIKHLNGIENDEFISAFRELQNLIVSIYGDIEKSPFNWGFPDFEQNEGYYHRVTDFLFGFARNGIYKEGILTVDYKAFFADPDVKRHRKAELIVQNLSNFGFVINGYGKKSKSFEITYPDNNNLINVLYSYVNALCENDLSWATDRQHPCHWTISRHKYGFSYRYVEEPTRQNHELPFLIEFDLSTEEGKKVLLLVHDEAAKHGYYIDLNEPMNLMFHNSLLYKNGDKKFLFAGENQRILVYGGGVRRGISVKAEFRNVFTAEKEKMDKLIHRFPDTFKGNCNFCFHRRTSCQLRMKYIVDGETRFSCSGHSFWFENLTINDVADILEMFQFEIDNV